MKTTLLLHGGRLKINDPRNDAYFARLTRDLKAGDTLLFVGFARTYVADRQEVYEREKNFILAQTTKNIQIVNATEEDLTDQLARAQAIHITGGESPQLMKIIQRLPNFLELIKGKVVGGSSAGACLMSEKYWYGEENTIHRGLGVLPIGVFVHYGSEEFHATYKQYDQFVQDIAPLEPMAIEECAWNEVTL